MMEGVSDGTFLMEMAEGVIDISVGGTAWGVEEEQATSERIQKVENRICMTECLCMVEF